MKRRLFSSITSRFAYSLLEKLLEYVDKAAYNMKNMKPSSRFSRRHSFSMSTEDVKFFGKVGRVVAVWMGGWMDGWMDRWMDG